MKAPSKKEKKLLKAAKKLEKLTKKYIKDISKIDTTFQNIPTKITRRYSLEDRYFKIMPIIAIDAIKLELLYSHLASEIMGSDAKIKHEQVNDL